jgi:uncharacterized Tic20 family protein
LDNHQPSISPAVRVWAAISHLNVIVSIPLLFIFFKWLLPEANRINRININCVFKPFPGCDTSNRALLLLVNGGALLLLWGVPFISPCITMAILKIQKALHPFIQDNAREALKSQLDLSGYIAVLHLMFVVLLSALSGFLVGPLGGLVIVTLTFDLFFFSIFVGVQLIIGIFAANYALKGCTMRYPRIRW